MTNKNSLSAEAFAALCFLILMPKKDIAYPTYLEEKTHTLLKSGYEAYSFLDRNNQAIVFHYLHSHNLQIPEWVAEYEKQLREMLQND